jgi:hypothetical protein
MPEVIDNPFEVAKKKFDIGAPPEDDTSITGLIRRLAAIDDELASRGIDPLAKEQTAKKKSLKNTMLKGDVKEAFDEVSEWEAVLTPRSSDEWDIEKLKAVLTPSQRKRYIVKQEVILFDLLAEGLKNGDLKRAELEYKGAVTKVPTSLALYVRHRKPPKEAK